MAAHRNYCPTRNDIGASVFPQWIKSGVNKKPDHWCEALYRHRRLLLDHGRSDI
jgi:hypothetical protein